MLEEIAIPLCPNLRAGPAQVAKSLWNACAAAVEDGHGLDVPALVSSHPELSGQVLAGVLDALLPADSRMVEWGSGLGSVTCMADALGFQACGIEIEPALVEVSRQIAAKHQSGATFVQGSYIPDSARSRQTRRDELILPDGRDVADAELIYCFPWPAEEPVVEWLFDRFARPQTLLLTYHGGGKFRLRRRAT